MKDFLDNDFLLESDVARELYHNHAAKMPIIDYHCHLDPAHIANDKRFDNLGQIWLEEDHYKWRALRANGISEHYITGKASDWDKFKDFAASMPYFMRNPLYHWTHLELRRVFDVDTVLNASTARTVYDECTAKLRTPEFSARGLMRRFNVRAVCTTDDPVDSLEHHLALRREGFEIKVLPTWRPDKAMAVENPTAYRAYVERLSEVSGLRIACYDDLLTALADRHQYFANAGCRLSDHGMEEFYAADFSKYTVDEAFNKVYGGKALTADETLALKSAISFEGALMDHAAGWTQQFHFGPIRNLNSRLFAQTGPDAGFDSMSDRPVARDLAKFLNRLDVDNRLAKTIVYNLNPRDNALIATMLGNFQDGSVAGKMQFGAAWWFLDQQFGIAAQINTLSTMGLLSRFVGMLTDSRSFLSYPRHEYFRRILCNILGGDVERGELPASELPFIKQMVEDICFNNAEHFFDF